MNDKQQDIEETEGHIPHRKIVEDETDDEETEGHVRTYPALADQDDEGTEGHGIPPRF